MEATVDEVIRQSMALLHEIVAGETAIERVLGAPRGLLPIADKQTFATWFED